MSSKRESEGGDGAGAEREAEGGSAPEGRRPVTVTVAAVISAAQGLTLLAWGVYGIVAPLFSEAAHLGRAEAGGLVLSLLGAIPLAAARGLLLRRRWSRSPALTFNLFCVAAGWVLWQAGGAMRGVAVGVAVTALVGLVLLLRPETGRVLGMAPGTPVRRGE